MNDYEVEEKKQAAADVLFQYSQSVMVCIGESVQPSDLRLHLMKEISGMPTSLKTKRSETAISSDSAVGPTSLKTKRSETAISSDSAVGKSSSSRVTRGERADSSRASSE